MDVKLKTILSLLLPSSLSILFSIPLILKQVPPNCYYGFRLAKTLSNKDIWFKVNRFGGICLLVAGIVSLAGCGWLYVHKAELSFIAMNNIGIVMLVVPVVLAIGTTMVYMRNV